MGEMIDELYRKIGQNDINQDVKDFLSTGYLPLNKIISGSYAGGIGVGRITEIYGGASAGKTLLATMAMIETQKKGGLAVFLDYEHAFSVSRAQKLGLSTERNAWIYKQPETLESGFAVIETICNVVRNADTERFVTVIIDSVSAMPTKAEVEAGFENTNMKTNLSLAATLSALLKKLAGLISKNNITLIFLNQTRTNPTVIYGNPESTSGGNSLKFYASTRVRLSKGKREKDGDLVIGETVHAEIVKNKIYEPFHKVTYITSFKYGINLILSHVQKATEMGFFGETKGWCEYQDKKWRVSQLTAYFNENPDEYQTFLTECFKD